MRDHPGASLDKKEHDMRAFIIPAAISVLTVLGSVEPSSAEVTYPFCAQYGGGRGGGRNCGFWTWEQCLATVWGNGGYCEANPMYVPLGPPPGRKLRRTY
jgi:Protein of unknown function (DUF3551)